MNGRCAGQSRFCALQIQQTPLNIQLQARDSSDYPGGPCTAFQFGIDQEVIVKVIGRLKPVGVGRYGTSEGVDQIIG